MELLERVACIPPPGVAARRALEAVAESPCRVAELRLDLQGWSREEAGWLVEELSSRGVRVIVTLRDSREGGRYQGDPGAKLSLLSWLVERGAWMADFEYRFLLLDEALQSLPGKVIVSVHFMEYTPWPEILYAAAGDMIRRGAAIAKVVAYARRLEDNWRLLGLNIKWPLRAAAFAMGEKGRLSRILAPLLGAALTYASLGEPVAPGQLTLSELVEAWRLLGVR